MYIHDIQLSVLVIKKHAELSYYENSVDYMHLSLKPNSQSINILGFMYGAHQKSIHEPIPCHRQ